MNYFVYTIWDPWFQTEKIPSVRCWPYSADNAITILMVVLSTVWNVEQIFPLFQKLIQENSEMSAIFQGNKYKDYFEMLKTYNSCM